MEFIGVVDPFIFGTGDTLNIAPLKRHALVFDRLAIPSLTETFLPAEKLKEQGNVIAEMQWLFERGLIFEPTFNEETEVMNPKHDEEFEASFDHALGMIGVLFGVDVNKIRESKEDDAPDMSDEEFKEILLEIKKITEKKRKKFFEAAGSKEFWEHVTRMTMHQTRGFSIKLREVNGMDAYPILSNTIPATKELPTAKSEVVRIVLNSLPVPDDTTSWEQIIEFRSDPDSRNKFIDLRNWMSEVARAELKPNEVAEKLEYLMSQYQRHMEVHKMKTNAGTLETIVVTGAEVLGDVVSFKWGKAAEALFSLKKRDIALLEGELTAPGNEVAYIVKANETFAS